MRTVSGANHPFQKANLLYASTPPRATKVFSHSYDHTTMYAQAALSRSGRGRFRSQSTPNNLN